MFWNSVALKSFTTISCINRKHEMFWNSNEANPIFPKQY